MITLQQILMVTNIINMNTQYVSPKLLLEFYKGEKIPPLAVKYDTQTHFNEAISRQRKNQYGNFYQSSLNKNRSEQNYHTDESINQVENELQKQIQQNRELRLIIKELQQNLEKLKLVNEQLIKRVEELQKRNSSLTETSQIIKRDISRKTRIQVYKQIQDYLRLSVEKFTEAMLTEKITPQCENRIELFLEQILNINNLSVRKALNASEGKKSFDEKEADKTIKEIMLTHSKEKSKQRNRELQRTKYEVLFEKLNKTAENIRPGQIINRSRNSPSKGNSDIKIRRPKIFTNSNHGGQRSNSRDIEKRLDF